MDRDSASSLRGKDGRRTVNEENVTLGRGVRGIGKLEKKNNPPNTPSREGGNLWVSWDANRERTTAGRGKRLTHQIAEISVRRREKTA